MNVKYNEEKAIEAIKNKNNKSVATVIRAIGMCDQGGHNYVNIYKTAKKYNLDTSHWLGQGWSKGANSLTDERIGKNKYDKIFSENSSVARAYVKSLVVKNNLLPYCCEICKINDWLGKIICLDLDHKNGINNDNRLENLRFLCPNCYSQQPTTNRTRKKREIVSEELILETAKTCKNIRQVLIKLNLTDGFNYYRIKRIFEKHQFEFSCAHDETQAMTVLETVAK